MRMRRRYHRNADTRPTPTCHEEHISVLGHRDAIGKLSATINTSSRRGQPFGMRSIGPKSVETPPVHVWTEGQWRSEALQHQAAPTLALQVYGSDGSTTVPDTVTEFRDFLDKQKPELLDELTICVDPVVDSPFDSEDAPFDSEDAPFDSEDAPLAVDSSIAAHTVAGQPALERTGFNWLRQVRPDLTGQNVTVLILDTLPVQGQVDVPPEYVDFWIDWVVDESPPAQSTTPLPSPNLIPALEIHKYHGVIAASLIRHLAPASTIILARVLDDYGKGWSTTLIKAILWALAHRNSQTRVNGQRLIHDKLIFNLSMGLPRTQAEETEAVCLLRTLDTAAQAATLTVAAAGNDSWGKPENPIEPAAYGYFGDSPATAEQVIAVAGTDGLTEYAFFSNEGHLAAPCRHIIGDTGPNSWIKQTYGFSTVQWSGTSFAAPQVTGLAALLWGAGRVPYHQIKQHIWRTTHLPSRWNGVREIDYVRAFRAL
jgi:subtilisin family serine protease